MEPVNDAVPTPGNGAPIVDPAQQPAPAQPIVDPAQQPAAAQPAPQFQGGGLPPKKKFFDGITVTDIIIGSMVITGLSLAIYYYRNKIKHAQVEYPDLRADVDELKKKAEEVRDSEQTLQTTFGM